MFLRVLLGLIVAGLTVASQEAYGSRSNVVADSRTIEAAATLSIGIHQPLANDVLHMPSADKPSWASLTPSVPALGQNITWPHTTVSTPIETVMPRINSSSIRINSSSIPRVSSHSYQTHILPSCTGMQTLAPAATPDNGTLWRPTGYVGVKNSTELLRPTGVVGYNTSSEFYSSTAMLQGYFNVTSQPTAKSSGSSSIGAHGPTSSMSLDFTSDANRRVFLTYLTCTGIASMISLLARFVLT